MIVDKKGQIFEDRRKKDDRRTNDINITGEKRKKDRRKENQKQITKG